MHPQAIALFATCEALPAKVIVVDDKEEVVSAVAKRPRSENGWTIEITSIPAGRRTRLISFIVAGTSSTSINTL
jgi:hypothetical protein